MSGGARAWTAAAASVLAFVLYLAFMPPGLAPYRDAGEFAVAAHTLGVAHPPSYPLFVLVGRAFDALPLATTAYRLNLLSALCTAGAVGTLVWAVGSPLPGLVAAAAFALDAVPWSTAMVQEMYALMALAAALLLAGAGTLAEGWRSRLWLGLCFGYGAALANRTDLVLWAPGLAVLAWPPGERRGKALWGAAAAGLAGLSLYLFLPLRSSGGPWLDWNHPATLFNLWGSLTRRGYGGTLDLLSKSYAAGENFLPNLAVYGRHLFSDLGLWVVAPALFGALAWARAKPRLLAGTFLLYAASGPLFLYMANMPPNPHALAIVEPHYLLSDMVLCLWAGAGAAELCRLVGGVWPAAALAALTLVLPAAQGRFARMDRRWDLFAHDWADAALRSVPPGAVLVAKKDVQIFSLWHHQKALGRRPDVVAYAQGLAHSPWHQESLRRSGALIRPGALRSQEEWRAFLAANPETYVAMDAELPPGVPPGAPRGLAAPVPERPARTPDPAPFLVLRGDARYEVRPDFFSADLVESWAAARQRRGAVLAGRSEDAAAARRELTGALALKRRMPDAEDLLAYMALSAGDAAGAVARYEAAARLYDETFGLVREYRSLPETRRGIEASAADSAVNMGVAYEKSGRKDDAQRAYRRALALRPGLARAHFNIAVLHWGGDWKTVVTELEAALAADPSYADALRYLPQARAKLTRQ